MSTVWKADDWPESDSQYVVDAGTCDVSAEAKADFAMGSFHGQLAKYFMAALEEEQPPQAVVKVRCLTDLLWGPPSLKCCRQGAVVKLQELLDQLSGLIQEGGGLEGIRARKMPAAMERFCLNRASFSGMFVFLSSVCAVALVENLAPVS